MTAPLRDSTANDDERVGVAHGPEQPTATATAQHGDRDGDGPAPPTATATAPATADRYPTATAQQRSAK